MQYRLIRQSLFQQFPFHGIQQGRGDIDQAHIWQTCFPKSFVIPVIGNRSLLIKSHIVINSIGQPFGSTMLETLREKLASPLICLGVLVTLASLGLGRKRSKPPHSPIKVQTGIPDGFSFTIFAYDQSSIRLFALCHLLPSFFGLIKFSFQQRTNKPACGVTLRSQAIELNFQVGWELNEYSCHLHVSHLLSCLCWMFL